MCLHGDFMDLLQLFFYGLARLQMHEIIPEADTFLKRATSSPANYQRCMTRFPFVERGVATSSLRAGCDEAVGRGIQHGTRKMDDLSRLRV